jgi:hypothetical protein
MAEKKVGDVIRLERRTSALNGISEFLRIQESALSKKNKLS